MSIKTDLNEKLLEQVYGVYIDAELKMLDKVAKRAAKGATEGWAETKLLEVQKTRTELEAIMKSSTSSVKSKLSDSIVRAYLAGVSSASSDLGVADTALSDIVPLHIQRLVLESNNLIEGTSVQILRSVVDDYRSVLAESSTGVLTGVETRMQASQDALNRLASKGITGFIDKAGRKWDMASYVEIATRTVTARAALQGHIDRQLELGHDLIQISSIGVTCPICAPWQGKVLSLTGKTIGYESLATAKAAGLFHPNCKHTIMAYFPDVEDAQEAMPANDPALYEATQKQRYNERQIRKWKKYEAVAITKPDMLKAKNKIKYWQARQRELIDETGLRRNYAREGIRNRTGVASKAPTTPDRLSIL